ncbi:hypothetical protein QZH41_019913 [Actinostola sp. cb2023]|nr:hypothetical protein QZH41_019913 [Actinostola sp. cb2023]
MLVLRRDFNGTDGHTEFAIPVIPSLSPQDYVAIGRMITHQFVQCATFPIRLAQASIQQLLVGDVEDECKINSFLQMLTPKEREILKNALACSGSFPTEQVMDVLEDYGGIRQVPSPKNIRSLVLDIATSEFITKPFFCLLKIREGMGIFWEKITSAEIKSMYDLSAPSPERVINSLVLIPLDAKEQQVYRWLQRYLRSSSDEIIINFLRFCTATDVIVPGKSIAVDVELMAPEAVRPKSFTCFRKLILPRNYQSSFEMRNNLDRYLRDPSIWDLSD